jgi:hypothetical protein
MFYNKIVYRLFDFWYMHHENTMWSPVLRRRSKKNEARILDGYSFRQSCNLENKMVLSCAWIPTHPHPFVIPSPSHKTAALFVLSVIPIRRHFIIIYENSSVHTGMRQEDMTTTQCTMLSFLRWGTQRRTIIGTQLGEHAMQAVWCTVNPLKPSGYHTYHQV